MHPDEISISDVIARRLVEAQFPQRRVLPVRRVASAGTVNAIFRIGEDLAARFPLRAGDPAWHLLESGPRAVLREHLGSDDVEWERGKAWALEQAMGLVWYYAETNRPMSALGRRTLTRVLAAGDARGR